ncbi:MAG: 23S rRNA (adenine(2503)-C(2))-methyltransferase RlmN [Candidatus Omnitrophota bacterium]
MQAILNFNLKDFESFLEKHGFARYAGRQIFSWIYKQAIFDFQQMTNLSKPLHVFLKRNFNVLGLQLIERQVSSDQTEKFLFALSGRQTVESVLIPTTRRLTACLSTQVGCRFACRFCASGAHGWQRNLETAEIIEQLIHLRNAAVRRINNIVFMGVGEPLDNYDNVFKAIRILNSADSFNIGARKITISTCGLIPGILRLSEENLQIELSISLHAADNQTRSFLVPINKKYPLEELFKTCRAYFKKTKRQITFEYVLVKDVNSDLKQAKKLVKLFNRLDAKINLISLSANKSGFSPPNKLETLLFRDVFLKAGIPAEIRRSRGSDIMAACGQLRSRLNEV